MAEQQPQMSMEEVEQKAREWVTDAYKKEKQKEICAPGKKEEIMLPMGDGVKLRTVSGYHRGTATADDFGKMLLSTDGSSDRAACHRIQQAGLPFHLPVVQGNRRLRRGVGSECKRAE